MAWGDGTLLLILLENLPAIIELFQSCADGAPAKDFAMAPGAAPSDRRTKMRDNIRRPGWFAMGRLLQVIRKDLEDQPGWDVREWRRGGRRAAADQLLVQLSQLTDRDCDQVIDAWVKLAGK